MLYGFKYGGETKWLLLAALSVGFIACGDGSSNGGDASTGTGAGGAGNAGGGSGQSSGGQGGGGQGGAGGGIVDPNLRPMFVAQGMMGRTIISCDDGQTWVGNRSDDDTFVCFASPTTDCDHNPGAGRGIDYGDGFFAATFGWGQPGSIRRSKNGVDWEKTLEGKTFAGLVFGGNFTFLAGERPPQISNDNGMTWKTGGDPDSAVWNVRRTGFAAYETGRYLLAFESSGATDLNVSKDNGATWARPTTLPASCAASMQWEGGFAFGNGVIVVLGGDGVACRSLDGGDTWTDAQIGGTVSGRLLFGQAGEFVTWGQTADYTPVQFTSKDGAAWTTKPTMVSKKNQDGTTSTSPGPNIGAVAQGGGGTFVAVNGGWQQWYDKQRFYRSKDGVSWDELPAGSFVGSHPIQFITFGMGTSSAVCP